MALNRAFAENPRSDGNALGSHTINSFEKKREPFVRQKSTEE
jgi:hypothetical protein